MEKSMEERAKKYARQYRHPKLYEEAKQLYITIAEEQRDADIERSWKWILSRIRLIGSPMELHQEYLKEMKK